jgi:hypothetical protein
MEEIGIGTRVKHPEYGQGIICRIGLEYLSVSFFEGGLREIERSASEMEITEIIEPENNMVSMDEVEDMLERLLKKHTDLTEKVNIADKWRGGKMILEPKDQSLAIKEIPIDVFFHKVVMVRDRLRVLEQSINSNKTLADDEKVNLQQYITRMYGSLTTFNVLFKTKEDHFVGEGGHD